MSTKQTYKIGTILKDTNNVTFKITGIEVEVLDKQIGANISMGCLLKNKEEVKTENIFFIIKNYHIVPEEAAH